VPRELKELQANTVHPVLPGRWDPQELMVVKVQRAQQERMELLVPQELKAKQVMLEQQDQREIMVPKGQMDRSAQLDITAPRASKDLLDRQEKMDHLEQQVLTAQQVNKVLLALPDTMEQ